MDKDSNSGSAAANEKSPRQASRGKVTGAAKSKATGAARTRKPAPPKTLARRIDAPKWVTTGASVTGAIVAVGATLFATREEWMPRAKKLSETIAKTFRGHGDTASDGSDKADALFMDAPHFETSGADADFGVVSPIA